MIEGYEGFNKIYEKKIPGWHLPDRQIVPLLKCLAAKGGLDFDEIVGAYARRNSRFKNDLLEVNRDRPSLSFQCGVDVCFTARHVRK